MPWSRTSSRCREPTCSAGKRYWRWDRGGPAGRACPPGPARPAGGPMSEAKQRRVAAIDAGTNSLRLLIADIDPGRSTLTDLHRRMEIVRLGQGVDATGRLAPEALARTFAMLEEYARTISDSAAEAVRLVATSATRDASNASEFRSGVRRILGVEPEV